jgi:membrane protein DedA with SNARE-associated domain
MLMDILTTWLLDTAASPWAVLVILVFCALDGFFPVVPSETLVVAVAAVSWTTGSPALAAVIAAATVGAWAGDTVTWCIGRRLGSTPFAWMRGPRFTRIAARAEDGLRKRPAVMLITGRFIPVARIGITLAAGAILPIRQFLPLSAISAATWTTYTVVTAIAAGALLHEYPLAAAAAAVSLACLTGIAIDRLASAREARSQEVVK